MQLSENRFLSLAVRAAALVAVSGATTSILADQPSRQASVVSYRLFIPLSNGETLYGPWISPSSGDVADVQSRTVLPELAFNQTVFGNDICGVPLSPFEEPNPYVWTSWFNDIEVDASDAGAMVDGAQFAWAPIAIPDGFSGPYADAPGALRPGQFDGCHQVVWEMSFWETIDAGRDTSGDGLPDVFDAFPVFDAAGNLTGDITPVPNFSADLDGDGSPDVGDPLAFADQDGDGVNDAFLGGFQLFIIGGFFPGDTSGDGVANNPDDFICPDLDSSGDPFNDFFNPIVGGGWTDFSNYAQDGTQPGFPIDFKTGFTTAIDAGLGNAFDVDGDGSPDVPRLPADGSGAVSMRALNVIDADLDGTFDAFDGPALIGQPVVAAVDEFVPGAPVAPGFSGGLLYVEGEDRLGGGVIPSAGGGQPADGRFTPGSAEVRFAQPDSSQCLQIREPFLQIWVAPDAGRLCADQNNDGEVNGLDFGAWLSNFNAGDSLADVNTDGEINGLDFGAWLGVFDLGAAGPVCP